MTHRVFLAASVGAAALLGACEGNDSGSQAEAAEADLAEQGPYDESLDAPADVVETAEAARDPAVDAGRNGETARAGGVSGSLREAHRAVLEAGEPSEDAWLQVSLNGEETPHPVWHAMVMPGETIEISADDGFALSLDDAVITQTGDAHSWQAPSEPGVHTLRAFNTDREVQHISIFVKKPLNGQTVLEGYRIGAYPENPPEGLIRLTEADMDTPISPSFEIGQFICKQQIGHWPKFIMTSGPMLKRLELLLENLREDGRTNADTFFIMSGFRTPFYNTAIGSARRSRHMYGDASDIYPDVEGNDSVMDDLNNDGRVTREDAEWLYDYAARLYANSDEVVPGGIGAYGANAVHGPFVHIDGRGRAARWGR
ncbi:MAG: D-Ala-D-Ala carboxypeptidase family metallohydrolase [Oceanicaulis sp.]